jgi:metal-responsive CopG/Arc/MetJ family transcriptional regulator
MARKPSNGKETTSFSLKSTTLEALESFAEIMEISNMSEFADQAIREKIGRELAANPIAWKQLSQVLQNLAS